MTQSDGISRRGLLELGGRRKPLETRVVEALAAAPLTGGQHGGALTHGGQQNRDAPERRAVEMRVARGEGEQMEVRIDETRQHGIAAAIDPRRASTDGASDDPRLADGHDPTSGDRDRRRDRAARIARQDVRVLEQELDGINPTTEAASLP
jgi:hypothetical protein